jgi:hypothetical protein
MYPDTGVAFYIFPARGYMKITGWKTRIPLPQLYMSHVAHQI